ncbi:response regulator [Candidatus Kaiserbacteria bacterium]|nr:response regulator [Candidatus Kaiserbacteria bacterium]MCB9812734.1 response regulator [Candidatus Nomurabacteria bacterium]
MENNPKRIMIIEDEVMLLEALVEDLSDMGYIVDACTDVDCAFEQIQEARPDLILTDLVMAKVDGFDFIRILKENIHLKSIPVVVLSNLAEEGNVTRAKNLGAVDYWVKAEMSLADIVKGVQKLLGG